jgi:hypothetical protein
MAHFLFWPCEDCVGPGSSLGILGLVKFRSWVKLRSISCLLFQQVLIMLVYHLNNLGWHQIKAVLARVIKYFYSSRHHFDIKYCSGKLCVLSRLM